MTPVAQHGLVLFPAHPACAPEDREALTQALTRLGFIGAARQAGQFSAGPKFLERVVYLGCSPRVILGESEAGVCVSLLGPFRDARLRASRTARPRCPVCRRDVKLASLPAQPDERIRCPQCGSSHHALELDWRRRAGFGRFFVEISDVFEAEAVPDDSLLDALSQATGCSWDYFYLTVD